jgi:D-alanyl-D-alanine carboxypeptidase
MNPKSHEQRILAIVLRSRRFGFAVFEWPNRLLDWGMVFYPLNDGAQRRAVTKRVESLLTLFTPSIVVVGRTRLLNVRNGSGVRPILRSIRHEALSRAIPVHIMTRVEVREVFHALHAKSKHEIASMLAQMFPELFCKLPPERKIWESEHPIMTMFDAVALGFTYWQRDSAHDPPPD